MSAGLTLDEARDWLREHVDDGARCPCCTQYAKVYRRRIHSGMARKLIAAYQEHGTNYFNLPLFLREHGMTGRDESTMQFFGVVEELAERRDDGGRAGWWRVTPFGESYVKGMAVVPLYARIYNGRCLGFDGPNVTIRDALGKRFDYDELMRGG